MHKMNYWNNEKNVGLFKDKPPSQDLISFLESWKPSLKQYALDLGCGGGRHSVYLAQQGFKVFACDLHEDMVKATKHALQKVDLSAEVIEASFADTPYSKEYFDLIVSTGVLHNGFCVQDVNKGFKEISRILKPQGSLFLTIFTNNNISPELVKSELDAVYTTLDKLPMVLLSPDDIHLIAASENLQLDRIIREYETQVETGTRSVFTAVFRKN